MRVGGVLLVCLGVLGVWLWGSARVEAIGAASRFQIARLKVSSTKVNPRPTAVRRLLWEVAKRTSLRPRLDMPAVEVSDAKLFRYPLLYLPGEQGFTKWSSKDLVRMRNFLAAGGTLFVDMVDGSPGDAFDTSVRRLAKRLFPQTKMRKIPQKHTLLKSFYLIQRFGGRVLHRPSIEGVLRGDRAMIIYSMNDLGGAWERDNFGNWTYPVVPGGSSQREHAFRLGINIIMYALCVNYKSDMVHARFIMQRRK